MGNKFERRLAPIFKLLNATRLLLPKGNLQEGEYYFDWIKTRLDEIESQLKSIDTQRVIITRKAGEPTNAIYEDKLRRSLAEITGSTSILYSVKQLFNDNESHSVDILDRAQRIRDNALRIQSRLQYAINPYRVFLSLKPGLWLLIIGLVAVCAVFIYRAHSSGKSDWSGLKISIDGDVRQFKTEVEKGEPNRSFLERCIETAKQLKEIGQLAPVIITSLGAIWTAIMGLGKGLGREKSP